MNETAIRTIVEPILRSRFADFNTSGIDVRAGEDHDGDPVLFITVDVDPGPKMVGELGGTALHEIRSALIAAGEERFPHLRWHYQSGDDADDDGFDALLFADHPSS